MMAHNGLRLCDGGEIEDEKFNLYECLNKGTKPNVQDLSYAVMCWAVYQH